MTTYNFKKEMKAYLVLGGIKYNLDVYPDCNFSQTFKESNVRVKTLHSQYDMFDGAVINEANPANFNFTTPIYLEADQNVLLDLLISWDTQTEEALLQSADLYFETASETYKLEKAVFESGIFQITRNSPLLLSLSGTARKLSKYHGVIPGTLAFKTEKPTYTIPTSLEITLNGIPVERVTAINLEVSNGIKWNEFATVHDSLNVTNASDTMYPGAFVVESRTLAGTLQQYVTDESNSNVNTWQTNATLIVRAGNLGMTKTLEFHIPSIVFTNRLEVQDIYIQSYDFRMNANPDLATVINKTNIY